MNRVIGGPVRGQCFMATVELESHLSQTIPHWGLRMGLCTGEHWNLSYFSRHTVVWTPTGRCTVRTGPVVHRRFYPFWGRGRVVHDPVWD